MPVGDPSQGPVLASCPGVSPNCLLVENLLTPHGGFSAGCLGPRYNNLFATTFSKTEI